MAYAELGLPKAPAIMADGETIVEGKDIDDSVLEMAISRYLSRPKSESPAKG